MYSPSPAQRVARNPEGDSAEMKEDWTGIVVCMCGCVRVCVVRVCTCACVCSGVGWFKRHEAVLK
jgi:hypothetical protein